MTEFRRITVSARAARVDLSVPAEIPISLLLPDLVGLVDSESGSATGLARPGHLALEPSSTLAQLGVLDGELLVLLDHERLSPPLYDDVASTVAAFDDRAAGRPPTLVWISAAALLVSACIALGLPSADTLIRAIVGFTCAAVLFASSLIAAKTYAAGEVAAGLGLGSAAIAFTSAKVGIATPSVAGLLLGAALAGAISVVTLRLSDSGRALLLGTATLCALAIPALVLGTALPASPMAIAATLVVCGLIGLTLAPRLGILVSRLPAPDIAGSDNPPLPSFDELKALAGAADAYLLGAVGAGASAMTIGASAAIISGRELSWVAAALAAACAGTLSLRSRTFSSSAPRVAVLVAGTVVLGMVAVTTAVRTAFPLVGFGVALTGAALAVWVGTGPPQRRLTPAVQRTIDLLELGLIALIVPLACWTAGLFDSLTLR